MQLGLMALEIRTLTCKIDTMIVLTLNRRGQMTLSKELLEHLGVALGGKVKVTKLPGGKIELRAALE